MFIELTNIIDAKGEAMEPSSITDESPNLLAIEKPKTDIKYCLASRSMHSKAISVLFDELLKETLSKISVLSQIPYVDETGRENPILGAIT
jgi:hypothetical protein